MLGVALNIVVLASANDIKQNKLRIVVVFGSVMKGGYEAVAFCMKSDAPVPI